MTRLHSPAVYRRGKLSPQPCTASSVPSLVTLAETLSDCSWCHAAESLRKSDSARQGSQSASHPAAQLRKIYGAYNSHGAFTGRLPSRLSLCLMPL